MGTLIHFSRLLFRFIVIAEQVERSVEEEPLDLLCQGMSPLLCLALLRRDGNYEISQQPRFRVLL